MTTKHTPGPWRLWGKADPSQVISDATGFIAQTLGGNDEANARLIAAAPELLEALKNLDEAYCRSGGPLTRAERNEDRKRLIAARAAIAKATRETT